MSFNIINPYQTFYDSLGKVRAAGLVTFFINKTSTKASIYSDELLTVTQNNPYTLDAYGRITGDIKFQGLMTLQVTNSDGSDVITIDNVSTIEESNSLRADLSNTTDLAKGVALVGQSLQQVDGVTALKTLTPPDSKKLIHLKYHTSDGDGGHGVFRSVTGAAAATYTDNNGTIILPTGGDGSTAWLRDYNGPLDASSFGASPSATASINATAINNALSVGGVTTITVNGTYLIDGTLTPGSESKFIINSGVVIKLDPAVAAGTDIIRITSKTGVIITGGGKLDGDRVNQTNGGAIGIEVSGGSDILINDIEIVDTKDVLIHIKSSCSDFTIRRVRGGTIEVGQSGIKVDAGCTRGLITECVLKDIGTSGTNQFGDGIYVEGSYIIISNNIVETCNRIGIVKEGAGTDVIITGNTVINCGGSSTNPPAGIWAEGGRRTVINGNIVDQSSVAINNYCIAVAASETVCSNNNIRASSNTATAITVSSNNATIDANKILCVGNSAIKMEGSALTGVIISNNSMTGMAIGIRATMSQQFLTITGNNLSTFSAGAATGFEFNTGSVTVVDSVFSNNVIHGPIGSSGIRRGFDMALLTRCTLSGNVIRAAYTNGIRLTGTAENILTGNIVSGSNISTDNWSISSGFTSLNNSGGLPDHYNIVSGITAFSGGGQASAIVLLDSNNEISTVAATSDSVRLAPAKVGMKITVMNNGVNALNLYPSIGDNIGAGVNSAVSLAAGANITYFAYDIDNWESV